METIKKSMADLMDHFDSKMADFQQNLQKVDNSPSVSSLAADFTTFKSFISTALNNLQQQVELIAQQLDRFEMHGRRKILLLHGVLEANNEDVAKLVVQTVEGKLKIPNFSAADISRCHRLGRSTGDKPRPILLKLRDSGVRSKLWFAKTGLKGSGVTLSEFLTKVRHDAFLAARQHFGLNKCWTRDGCVIVAGSDEERHRVYSIGDVQELIKSYPAPAAPTAASSPLPKEAYKKPSASRPKRFTKNK